jgi:hypothetical protein
MLEEPLIEEPTTRAGFVKRLAKTVAVGLGIALVPATNAWAPTFQCCPDSTHCSCPNGGNPFRCNGGCGGCCACLTETQCFFRSGTCPC